MERRTRVELANYLPYLVNRVGASIAEQFGSETLAAHGLSIAMWRVVAALEANGRARQIDLAGLTSIDASTLSRLVTRLVRRGLVTRARSAISNREVTVALSAKGAALTARLIPLARAIETDAAAGISADELAVVKRCLRRMYANMTNRQAATAVPRPKRLAG
ncbi:MAG: MarR family winged helix-turn-helix transcriptional regulator [Xanthobacteraceae bacterium]